MRPGYRVVALALACAACAASKSPATAPSSKEPGAAYAAEGDAPQSAYAAQPPPPSQPAVPSRPARPADHPPSAAPPQPASPAPGQPSGGAAPSRTMAIANATKDIEASQRELDVAAGDCRNACLALGSMDRAAGRLCQLTQGADARTCDDAKQRVYSARARVKASCGECPGGPSVDKSAPIPSIR